MIWWHEAFFNEGKKRIKTMFVILTLMRFFVVVISFLSFEIGVTENSRKTDLQMYSIFTLKYHIKNKIKF